MPKTQPSPKRPSSLRQRLRQLRTPVADLDLEQLRSFCSSLPDVTPIADAVARQEVRVVGEIASVRIVPRAGSPSLEATVSDGSAALIVVWTGRRHIAGISPGRRLTLAGRGNPSGPAGRLTFFNPDYELL
jgi:hypothetical protein